MNLLYHRSRRCTLSAVGRRPAPRASVRNTVPHAAIRELVAPGGVSGSEFEWEDRVRRALALIPRGVLPSFYLLRFGTDRALIPLIEPTALQGVFPEEIVSSMIAEDASTAIPIGSRDDARASVPPSALAQAAPRWARPVRGQDRLLGFWIGDVGPQGDPSLLAQIDELNHWIAFSHQLIGVNRSAPAAGSAGASPLSRWLAADSLMSLCTLAFSDFRSAHGLSRLLIVAHAGGWPVGFALTPIDEGVRIVDDWFAARECGPLTQQPTAGPACTGDSARLPEIDAALQNAGFRAGAAVETGRSTSYCVFWGDDLPVDDSVRSRTPTDSDDDSILFSPLWAQLRVALCNMARMEYLRELSHVDSITRVFNRRYFNLRLTEEISRARRFQRSLGLLVFDIDHFKNLNDSMGHQAGDAILRRLAEFVRWTVRSTDLLCRLSGDEFAILMPDAAADDCLRFGERLRLSLRNRRFTADAGGSAVPVEISIGGAVFPQHADHAESLLRCADMALLAAKQQGRNRFLLHAPAEHECQDRVRDRVNPDAD